MGYGGHQSLRPKEWQLVLGLMLLLLLGPGLAPANAQGSGITTSASHSRTEVVTALSVTQRIDQFLTQIVGRLHGGQLLFDQAFNAAFADPVVQAGVNSARLAITTAGGPGVIISGPNLLQRTETLSSTSATTRVVNSTVITATVTSTFGPATIPTGPINSPVAESANRGLCTSSGRNGVTNTTGPTTGDGAFPTGCQNNPQVTVLAGTMNININANTEQNVTETTTTTNTTRLFEQYELVGVVQPIGMVHTAVQSGVFDLAGRLLRRMGGEGQPGLFGEPSGETAGTAVANLPGRMASSHRGGGWGEAYGIRARTDGWQDLPGDRRNSYGFAGGASFAPAPWLLMGFAIDQGRTDVDVPDLLERGRIDLTQIGALARVSNGPFALALSGTYGFGSADTTRTLLGVSNASYDVRLWGGLAEASYRFDFGSWRVVPKAGLDYVRIETDGFLETGALGLVAAPNEADRSRAFAGLEVGHSFLLGPAVRLDLSAHARAITVLDGGERTLPVAFAATPGSGLVVRGIPERGAGIDLGAQGRLGLTANAALYAAYDGRFRDGYTAHAGTAGLKVVW